MITGWDEAVDASPLGAGALTITGADVLGRTAGGLFGTVTWTSTSGDGGVEGWLALFCAAEQPLESTPAPAAVPGQVSLLSGTPSLSASAGGWLAAFWAAEQPLASTAVPAGGPGQGSLLSATPSVAASAQLLRITHRWLPPMVPMGWFAFCATEQPLESTTAPAAVPGHLSLLSGTPSLSASGSRQAMHGLLTTTSWMGWASVGGGGAADAVAAPLPAVATAAVAATASAARRELLWNLMGTISDPSLDRTSICPRGAAPDDPGHAPAVI